MAMRTKSLLFMLLLVVVAAPAAAQRPDAKGCKDDPLFPNRMPHYSIEKCESRAFDFFDFFTVKPPKKRVEGQFTFIQYVIDDRANESSKIEVVRNYENALKKVGGKIHASTDWWVNGFMTVDGRQVWAQVEKGNGKIWLRIVREKAMAQTIVADAAALANDLRTTGHVVVDGIYFDTGSATLKAESSNAITEIAKLLSADPSLKIYVVGHTDSVGQVDANLALSQARAKSVVDSLARAGIASTRLRPFGNGPFAPVAANASEEGRARNRRVEIVKQ